MMYFVIELILKSAKFALIFRAFAFIEFEIKFDLLMFILRGYIQDEL